MVRHLNVQNDLNYSDSDENSFVKNNGFDKIMGEMSIEDNQIPCKIKNKMSIEEDMFPHKKWNQSMKKKNNKQQIAKLKVKNECNKNNRKYFDIDTVNNGDCFFDSISKMLPKKYSNAGDVRSSVMKYCFTDEFEWTKNSLKMLASADALNVTYEGNEINFKLGELDKYMSLMKKSGAWADDFWIAAVSKMENIKLGIYSPEGKLYAIYGEDHRVLDSILIYTGSHYYVRQYY